MKNFLKKILSTDKTSDERSAKVFSMMAEYMVERKNLTFSEKIGVLIDKILKYVKWRKATGALVEEKTGFEVPVKAVLGSNDFPEEYENEYLDKIAPCNQGKIGICVSCAMSRQLRLAFLKKGVDFVPSFRFGMVMAKWLDGLANPANAKIEGTWGLTMAKVHQKYGSTKESTTPSNLKVSYKKFIDYIFSNREIQEAKKFKIKSYAFVNLNDFAETLGAINKFGSISITVRAKDIWPRARGYHRILLVKYDKKNIYFLNSWGETQPIKIERFNKIQKHSGIVYIVDGADDKKIKKEIKKIAKKNPVIEKFEDIKIMHPKQNAGEKIVIHHGAYKQKLSDNHFSLYNAWHKERGFLKHSLGYYIGYNFVIEPDGTIKQGRKVFEELASHKNFNTKYLSINIAGDFTTDKMTKAQKESFVKLVGWIRKITGEKTPFEYHRNIGKTVCPGKNITEKLIDGLFPKEDPKVEECDCCKKLKEIQKIINI